MDGRHRPRRARPRRDRERGAPRRSAERRPCAEPRRATSARRIGVSSPRVRDRKQSVRPARSSDAASCAIACGQRGSAELTAEIAAGSCPAPLRRPNRLLEALAVHGDHPRGCLDDRRRASVVRREHHAPRGRVVLPEAKDAPHVGETPRVDRLVVVADDEEVVLRERQAAGRGEAGRRPRPGTRRRRRARIATASGGGAPDPSRAGRRRGPRDRRSRRRRAPAAAPRRSAARPPHRPAARDPPPSMPRATCRAAKPPAAGPMGPPRHAGGGRRAGAGADRRGCSTPRRRRGAPGARGRGACGPRSTSRPAPMGRGASRRAPARSCAASRLKVTTQIRAGCDAPREEHGQARDHRRRLAAAGRGDDLGRTVWQDRGGALLGIQGGQDRAEVDAGRCRDGGLHRSHRVRSSLTDGLAAGYR